MSSKNNLQGCALALFVLLTGCASNEPKPEEPAVAASQSAPPPPVPTVAITPQLPPPVDPSVVIPNPSIVTFEKMSITIDDKAKESIGKFANRAKTSNKITITGFCDRNQIRNSTDSAMARAVAVRDELLSYGVDPANIRLTLNTRVAKKHAAEIKFD